MKSSTSNTNSRVLVTSIHVSNAKSDRYVDWLTFVFCEYRKTLANFQDVQQIRFRWFTRTLTYTHARLPYTTPKKHGKYTYIQNGTVHTPRALNYFLRWLRVLNLWEITCVWVFVCVMLYLYLKLLLRANFKTAPRQQQQTKLQCSKLNSTKKEATALHVRLYNSLYNPRIIIKIKRKSIKPCNVCEMRSLPSSSLLPPRLLLTQLELCCPNKPLSFSHGMSTHVLHRTMNLVADIFQTQVDFSRKMDRTNLLMDLHAYVRNMRRWPQ